jgi:hypothetical protein
MLLVDSLSSHDRSQHLGCQDFPRIDFGQVAVEDYEVGQWDSGA